MKQNRTGIFIPFELMQNEDLDWINKILLSEIISLSKLDKGCIVSNETLGELLNLHRGNVSKRITFLVENGYIKLILKKEGKKRTTRTIIPQQGVSGNAQRSERKRTEQYADTHTGVSVNAQRSERKRCTTNTVTNSEIKTGTNTVTNSVMNTEDFSVEKWIDNFLKTK